MRFGSTLGLIAAGLLGAAAPAWPDRMRAELVGRYIWTDASPIFGGISGLELTPDGVHKYGGGYTEYVARTGHEAPGLHS